MKKKIFSLFFIFAILIGSASTLNAVTFSYDTSISATRTSGYSHASDNKKCSVRMYSTYLKSDYKTTATLEDYASDVYPTVSRALPASGAYFTIVNGTHKLGNNTYYSSHNR